MHFAPTVSLFFKTNFESFVKYQMAKIMIKKKNKYATKNHSMAHFG